MNSIRISLSLHLITTLQSLLNTLQKNYTRSERDNNLIYHHEIPAASTLAPIQETSMVRSAVPSGLENPKTALGEESPLFDELLGWGAREAISKPSFQLSFCLCYTVKTARHICGEYQDFTTGEDRRRGAIPE